MMRRREPVKGHVVGVSENVSRRVMVVLSLLRTSDKCVKVPCKML